MTAWVVPGSGCDDPIKELDVQNESLLDFRTIDRSELGRYSNGIKELYARDRGGFVIRNVFSQETIDRVLGQLERGEHSFPMTTYPWGTVYGRTLITADDDYSQYCEDAGKFRSACRELFRGEPDFEETLADVLGTLYSGGPVGVPAIDEDRSFTPATIRRYPSGSTLEPHCGNMFAQISPKFQDLMQISDVQDQLSYFVLLQKPTTGGEFFLYDVAWDDVQGFDLDVSDFDYALQVEANHRRIPLKVEVGDMLLFSAGQLYHSVSTVEGDRPRITIGGFVSRSRDDEALHFWS